MPKAYGQASEIRGQLKEVLQGLGYNVNAYNQNVDNEEAILKCVATGMVVHLYRHTGGGSYRNGDSRQLAKESIINRLNNYPEWIVGKPMNISFTNRRGRKQTIELVSCVTSVKPEWMAEVLAAKDRKVAAPTFMPDGLYLAKIAYPEEFGIPAPWLENSWLPSQITKP